MPIIEMETWKDHPDKPGIVIFDKLRVAQDIFDELEAHLKADGRMPDEYFMLNRDWGDGKLFPRNADIICNVNFGSNEGVYLNISVRYEKDVPEFNGVTYATENVKRMVTENFATGKTLGQSIEDLDRMNLVASSVIAAFYGMEREVRERYAQVESGEVESVYPRQSTMQAVEEKPFHSVNVELLASDHHHRNNPKFMELAERIDKNFYDYQKSLEGFGIVELFDMANNIKAMCDAHSYMLFYHTFSDYELEFYLQFQDPLEIVGDVLAERNSDVGDVGYVLDYVKGRVDDFGDYPLINAVAPSADNDLRRYMNIDLGHYLGEIAKKVTENNTDSWKNDLAELHKAALSDNPEEKRLFWQVCSYGSGLVVEGNTFIKDTFDYNCMTNYQAYDPGMFGFYIEVTGTDGEILKGNVFEIGNCAEFAKHLQETAEPLESVTLIYSDDWGVNAGKVVNVSKVEFTANPTYFMSESGTVSEKVFHPKDKVRLAALISNERAKRMVLPIGNTAELLRKVEDKLAKIRREEPDEQEPPAAPVSYSDNTEKTEKPKPKSLAEKMQAANEKVKAQDAQPTNTKPQKREERE